MDTKKPTDHSEEKAKEEPSASDVVEDNETEKVSYIPSFTDTTEDGDPLILRASPQQLIWNTIKHGIYHIWALPLIVVPLGPWAMSS